MAWAPVRNFFAIHAVDHSAVLDSGDDLAALVERRRIFEQLAGGQLKFSIVWGLDGAPVTRAQADRMLRAEEYEDEIRVPVEVDVEVDGQKRTERHFEVRRVKRMGPAPPRSIRPEAWPGPPAPTREPVVRVDERGWRITEGGPDDGSANLKQNGCTRCAGVATWGAHAPGATGDPLTDPDEDGGAESPPSARDRRGAGVVQPAGQARRAPDLQVPEYGERGRDRGVRRVDRRTGHADPAGRGARRPR